MDTRPALNVPTAIVIAALLIAGALYLTRVSSSAPTASENQASDTKDVVLREVSSKDHILGDPNADIVIVEYSDTECPYCKEFHKTMHRIIDSYGKSGTVAWVYRHFPIEQLHRKANREAQATECAAEQGGNSMFWSYVDRIYEVTPSNDNLDPAKLTEVAEELGLNVQNFTNCLDNEKYKETVDADYADALRALGRGTPHNVLIVKKKLNDEALSFIRAASQELPAQTLVLSSDHTKLVMMGALPYDFLNLLIQAITGKTSS